MFLGSRLVSRYQQVTATIVIFALSAGILGGLLFYVDSIGPTVFQNMIDESPNHMQVRLTEFYYQHSDLTLEEIHSTIEENEKVQSTDDVMVLEGYNFDEEDSYYEYTYLGVQENFFSNYPNAFTFEGEVDSLSNETCYIERNVATSQNINVGDNYTIGIITSNETFWGIQVDANFTVAGVFDTNLYQRYNYWTQEYTTSLRAIVTRDAMNSSFGAYGYGGYEKINEEIWVRFDTSSISVFNPVEMGEDLQNTARKMEQNLIPYIMVYNFELLEATTRFSMWSTSMTLLSLSFSVPTLTMGFMLISYNSNLLADQRRRDVGMIKTRGATSWQAASWVLSNSLITGILGSLASILIGVASAFLSGSVKTLLIFDFTMLAEFSLLLRVESVIFVFLFAFISGLIVSIPTAIRALLMTPTEAHQVIMGDEKFSHESLGSPMKEVIALGIGLYLLIILVGFILTSSRFGYSMTGIAFLMFPVVGIISIAGGRLLSRPAASIKSFLLEKIPSVSMASTKRLVSRSLLLYKKSEAMGVMFLGLVFTAGLFSAISASTGTVHLQNLYHFEVGSDINADIKTGENASLSMVQNITEIEGIESASGILEIKAFVSYLENTGFSTGPVNSSISIIGIDSDTWLESAFLQDYFTADATPQESFRDIQEDDSKVIASFRPIQRYQGGGLSQRIPVYHNDITLHFETPTGPVSHNCEIIDVMAAFDSATQTYGSTYFPGKPQEDSFIIVNLDYLHGILETNGISEFYIKTNQGANHSQIVPSIYELNPELFESIDSAQLKTDQVLESRMSQAVFGSYTLNVIFSLIYLTVGMIIVAIIKTRNFRKEFSILRALGTENESILKTVIIETGIGLALSIAIGTTLSILFTQLVIRLPLVFMGSNTSIEWNRLPIFMFLPIELIVIIVAIAIVSTIIATALTMRYYLSRNIAEEIQYSG